MRAAGSAVSIGLLLPEVLGTYSDRGNATVLTQRLRWRGIPADIVEVTADRPPPTTCDVYLLGGGEDGAEEYVAAWLTAHPALRRALRTTQVLAVCAGLQVLGAWIRMRDGRRLAGADVLDITTRPGRRRAVGEVLAQGLAPELGTLTGFENHRGATTLGPATSPLGRVLRGTGNGDGHDGVLTPTVVGTYLHGPVLVRNPALADLLLRRATGLATLPPLEIPDEDDARRRHLALSHARGRRALLPAARLLRRR